MLETWLTRTRAALAQRPWFLPLAEQAWAVMALRRALLHPVTRHSRGCLVCLTGVRGTGKTFLLYHVLRELQQVEPESLVVVAPATYWRDRLQHIQHGESADRWWDELSQLRAVALENFDAVHAPTEQSAWGDLWCWWIDEILSRGVSVIWTMQTAPAQRLPSTPRLLSRLHAGMVGTLSGWSMETRQLVIRLFCEHHALTWSDTVQHILAERGSENPRTFCETLQQLVEHKQLTHAGEVERYLSELQPALPTSLHLIAQAVAREFGVSLHEMRSAVRCRAVCLPRQCAMYLSRQLLGAPLDHIGRYFGHRSHSSVLHSCRQFQQHLAHHPALQSRLDQLAQSLRHELTAA
ncbi:MAG: hypothetical protein KatS3mg114_1251 [Planctomycetaceae bacterium]|nr:MAG: hypothetical protein KatS3mg114_1251 [Planctomycetaceae bacterium]